METLEERRMYLNVVYQKAIGAGICRTLKEWAEQLGVNKSGLSSAMNGTDRFCTPSLVIKVKRWAQENGLEDSPAQPRPEPQRPPIVIPAETLDLYTNLSRAIADLADIVRRAGYSIPPSAQKNLFRDTTGEK